MAPAAVIVVDYGAGNLRSVAKAVERLGYEARVTDDPRKVLGARAVILPGVGASDSAMRALRHRGLVEPLQAVIRNGVPLFGVCLGMQLLLDSSEEGVEPCLGVVAGQVKRFLPGAKVPHMGWNQVDLGLDQGVASGSNFYFVHSYYAAPKEPSVVLGTTEYGVRFCSALAAGNLIATQFHPEKSGATGLRLYENFLRMALTEGGRA